MARPVTRRAAFPSPAAWLASSPAVVLLLIVVSFSGAISPARTATSDPCAVVRCKSNRECVVVANGTAARCECKKGYVEKDGNCIDPCATVRCAGGAMCKAVKSGIMCVCPKGETMRSGKCVNKTSSSPPTSSCSSAKCAAPMQCRTVKGKAVCVCKSPLVKNKRTGKCEDPCDTTKCPSHAVCKTVKNDGLCFCEAGYAMKKGVCVKA